MTAVRVAYVLGTTAGGTGRHVAMLAAGCAAAGLEVQVYGPAETADVILAGAVSAGVAQATEGPGGVRFEPVPVSYRPRPARDAAAVRMLRRLLTGAAPDIVHAHGMRAGALAALALRPAPLVRWPGGKLPALIVTVHNAPPAAARTAAVYGLLERLVARRADVVLCVSADLSDRMRRLGTRQVGKAIVPASGRLASAGVTTIGTVPPRETVTGHPDAGVVAPDAGVVAELDSGGRPVVLAVGRLAPQKGLDTLLAAAVLWAVRRPKPLLVIAGTGPLAAGLAARAHELGLDARFLGQRDDVPELLAACDVFVLPSQWEGQPLIAQEALRAGRPVVATDVGGVRDLTGDHAALLVQPGDPAAFAEAVLRVLDDPVLAARLASAAAARAAALPTEAEAVAAVLALYRQRKIA
ncbi:MAG TPA: glycosyltransferase [Streptosporangiaceae bacterium]|nr:glycosyltransferase [Streptosporangiaceae bacterium]